MHRTIFVVGDKKQSIYSFQGADPREFDRMREILPSVFDHRQRRSGRSCWITVPLLADDPAAGRQHLRGAEAARLLRRPSISPSSRNMPGRVDLWPHVPKTEEAKPTGDWCKPVIRSASRPHRHRARPSHRDRGPARWSTRGDHRAGDVRRMHAGDVLILVRGGRFITMPRSPRLQAGRPAHGRCRPAQGMAELAVRTCGHCSPFSPRPRMTCRSPQPCVRRCSG